MNSVIKVLRLNHYISHNSRCKTTPGAVFTNIPILVLVLTLEVYHFNHMPNFISITVSTSLGLKSSCRINILLN